MKVLLGYEPTEPHLSGLQAVAAGAEIVVAQCEADAQREIVDADAYLGNRWFLQALPAAHHLAWMQSGSSGMDLVLRGGERLREVTITSARGVYDDEVADHAVALLLMLRRRLHIARDNQTDHRWLRVPLPPLRGTQAMVLGFGGVGRSIAARLNSFGIEVQGVRRRPAGELGVLGPEEWRARLGRVDHLVVALPETGLTRGIVGQAELSALPVGAVVVNVGRGSSIDTDALVSHLRTGDLAGAALDVFEREPLAAAHPLWSEERVVITPHVARSAEQAPFRWEPLFEENLRRFVAGEPLLNVVDKEAGY
jgi:phosphoglycerate dehydrogenase-like enzyme